MNINYTNKLAGAIVGIGFIKNGVLEYKELDKPIHNKITSVGLDHLLTLDGTNACLHLSSGTSSGLQAQCRWSGTRQVDNYSYSPSGVISYAAYGSGTGVTNFTDTELVNKISDYTMSYVTDTGMCGTKSYTDAYGKYSYRLTYQFLPASETQSVNEVGFFGKFYNKTSSQWEYYMFSRVALPETIVLEKGVSLVVTYQIDETNNYNTTTEIDFFGLNDSEGNPLKAQAKLYRYCPSVGNWNDYPKNQDYINSNGRGYADNSRYFKFMSPFFTQAYVRYSENNFYGNPYVYSTNTSVTLPNDNAIASYTHMYHSIVPSSGNGVAFNVFTPYVCKDQTSKYRDIKLVLGNNFGQPSDTDYIDLSLLGINGIIYRFGYYNGGTFVPQTYRKYTNKSLVITSRVRYTTEDTTTETYDNPNEVKELYVLVPSTNAPSLSFWSTYPYENYSSNYLSTGMTFYMRTNPVEAAANGTTFDVSAGDPSMLNEKLYNCTITAKSDGQFTLTTSVGNMTIYQVSKLF